VSWVPPGPASFATPFAPASWYGTLYDHGDCQNVVDLALHDNNGVDDDRIRSLYAGLGEACLAVSGAGDSHWSSAATYFSQVGGEGVAASQPVACLDVAAYRLLDRLLDAHRASPDAVVLGDPMTGTACPFAVTSLEPASGPVEGGTSVTITGQSLWDVDKVLFGDVQATVEDPGDGAQLVVTAPPVSDPGAVPVVLEASHGERATRTVEFTYVAASATP
jgi:hypothetical protein